MTALLDANVLIALTTTDHVHHELAERWYRGQPHSYSTCPLTQGALVRFLLRAGSTARQAMSVLDGIHADSRHTFWADDLDFREVDTRGVIGHRQVTDAYLAGLARNHGGRLLTMDRGLAVMHADVVDLIDG